MNAKGDKGDKKDAFDVAADDTLKGTFASAIEDTVQDSSEGKSRTHRGLICTSRSI